MHEILQVILGNISEFDHISISTPTSLHISTDTSMPDMFDTNVPVMEDTADISEGLRVMHSSRKRKRNRVIEPAKNGDLCPCCLETIGSAGIVLKCGHPIHTDCFYRLLPTMHTHILSVSCPMCRVKVQPEDISSLLNAQLVTVKGLLRTHRACRAMQRIRNPPLVYKSFVKDFCLATDVQASDGIVYNVFLINIDRSIQWKKMLMPCIGKSIRGNPHKCPLEIVSEMIEAHTSTLLHSDSI